MIVGYESVNGRRRESCAEALLRGGAWEGVCRLVWWWVGGRVSPDLEGGEEALAEVMGGKHCVSLCEVMGGRRSFAWYGDVNEVVRRLVR